MDPAFPPESPVFLPKDTVFSPHLQLEAKEIKESFGFGRKAEKALLMSDAVFFALHGGAGEDGRLKAFCELIGVKTTGNRHDAEAAAMDKNVSKALYAAAGIKTPKWRVIKEGEKGFLPSVIKPLKDGSSAGVFICKTESELKEALESADKKGGAMIERYVKGREISVSVLFGKALPPVEIVPDGDFYDFSCKYTAGRAKELCPAPITPKKEAEVKRLAEAAHRALGLTAVSRSDFIMTKEGEIFCLETNASPGLTESSLLPLAASKAGISFSELCERLLEGVI